jgi:hypothetical protein
MSLIIPSRPGMKRDDSVIGIAADHSCHRPGLIDHAIKARRFTPAGLPWHFQPADTGAAAFVAAADCACSVTR